MSAQRWLRKRKCEQCATYRSAAGEDVAGEAWIRQRLFEHWAAVLFCGAECSRRGIYRDEDQSSFAFCAPVLILHLPMPAVFAREKNTTTQIHPQIYMKSRCQYRLRLTDLHILSPKYSVNLWKRKSLLKKLCLKLS